MKLTRAADVLKLGEIMQKIEASGAGSGLSLTPEFQPYCDFCGKTAEFVFYLVEARHGAHICDECVDVSKRVVDQRRAEDAEKRAGK